LCVRELRKVRKEKEGEVEGRKGEKKKKIKI
jgi:hypothetical protein